jgi:endo-1,3-1,4-beta-glycanase ExoK
MSPHGPRRSVVLLLVSLMLLVFALQAGTAPKRPVKPPPEQGSFVDLLDVYDTSRWMKADGWKNGSPFDNAWSAENVLFEDGDMIIRLDATARLGEPYSSGNYQTLGFYGYGCYEASFRPIAVPGVVTSFFTFAGPYDNGGNGKHNEIDIEFLGNHFFPGPPESAYTEVQFNFYTNDDNYASRNEYLHRLGFDASLNFHRYGFKWTSTGIGWYVDGERVYGVGDKPTNPTPKTSDSLQKIMMNVWPVDATAAQWAGTFVYPNPPVPLDAVYQWVRFTKLDENGHCVFGDAPDEPANPPLPGEATALLVSDIGLTLTSRDAQVIARVSVIDGTGKPAAGATVTGTWSGSLTTGDTLRDTNAEGIATFYSARSRSLQTVTFCVAGVSRTGSEYDSGSNWVKDSNGEPCITITK